jgi:Nucleotidyltransferase domain
MNDQLLTRLIEALRPVQGVAAVVLGGSRGRGTAGPTSDYDIGLYYEPDMPLDVAALNAAIAPLRDNPLSKVTRVGEWGPWINGGGWITISGVKVDLLYRDLGAVRAVIADAKAGHVTMHYQPGHPHGFCSAIWMGEVATCQPLHDPYGLIGRLKGETMSYPPALRDAIIKRFGWEVVFAIENAEIAVGRAEGTHIAGCAYRALCCIAQVLFALNGRYLINEKGAVAEAATLPVTIEGLTEGATEVWATIGDKNFQGTLRCLKTLAGGLQTLLIQKSLSQVSPR